MAEWFVTVEFSDHSLASGAAKGPGRGSGPVTLVSDGPLSCGHHHTLIGVRNGNRAHGQGPGSVAPDDGRRSPDEAPDKELGRPDLPTWDGQTGGLRAKKPGAKAGARKAAGKKTVAKKSASRKSTAKRTGGKKAASKKATSKTGSRKR